MHRDEITQLLDSVPVERRIQFIEEVMAEPECDAEIDAGYAKLTPAERVLMDAGYRDAERHGMRLAFVAGKPVGDR